MNQWLVVFKNMDEDKLRIGNFSARMRMSVLYDVSSREKSLVVGTSNRSELLLGYGTILEILHVQLIQLVKYIRVMNLSLQDY